MGECDKVRVREASALAGMGKVDAAINKLEEAILIENREDTSGLPEIERLLGQLKQGQLNMTLAQASLEKNEFSRAKRLFQQCQVKMTNDPVVQLGLAKCFLGLGEFEDASREAQKVREKRKTKLFVSSSTFVFSLSCAERNLSAHADYCARSSGPGIGYRGLHSAC